MARIIALIFLATIVVASITQIPWLLTISTALFWIYAVLSPIVFLINVATFEKLKQVSTGEFLVRTILSFIALGVFAYVGWAWVFAWVMLSFFVSISAASTDKKAK